MKWLNGRSIQSKQLRLRGIQAGSQLIVPRRELRVSQRRSCLGRSAALGSQALQSCINRTKLALKSSDLVRLDVIDAPLELVASRVDGGEEGRARRPQQGARGFSLRRNRLQRRGDGAPEVAEEGVCSRHARSGSCDLP